VPGDRQSCRANAQPNEETNPLFTALCDGFSAFMGTAMAKGETEFLLRLQTAVLEAVARGETLASIGDEICRGVEASSEGIVCSILQVDENGALRPLSAPSLPDYYCRAIDGILAGPAAGSCGTAAYRKEPVLVTDIETDPLWHSYKSLPLDLGLRACWSSPICDKNGVVVSTFAFYYRCARGPTAFEASMVETCVHLCALAIEHERVRARNHRLAYYDALTGLPNRGRFNEVLADRVALGAPFGLILLDIDHLKLVNDSIGHAAGDALIRAVATRLSTYGNGVMPCRLGGDEMAVIVTDCTDHSCLERVAHGLLQATHGMVSIGDQSVEAHVTMGGALFGADGHDADTLCQNADFALYHAKQTHRGSYMGFRPDLRTDMVQRIGLIRQVDSALSDGRIIPHYQPIVRLETSEIVGIEALARLAMPDGRLASAGEFHTAMEDPRIAYELTGTMLEQVARDIRGWLDADIPVQHVGVNVTTGDFQRGNLSERVSRIFAKAGVPLHHVILEVNESVFMGGNDRAVPHAVESLRDKGILVALDDFGTGFASLTHLLSFPVDIIKIDKSFVGRLGKDRPAEVVVSAILDIARKLDMRVVAEGIESMAQAEFLRQEGCKLGQGYLFSRPVAVADATKLLRNFAQSIGGGKTTSAAGPRFALAR